MVSKESLQKVSRHFITLRLNIILMMCCRERLNYLLAFHPLKLQLTLGEVQHLLDSWQPGINCSLLPAFHPLKHRFTSGEAQHQLPCIWMDQTCGDLGVTLLGWQLYCCVLVCGRVGICGH